MNIRKAFDKGRRMQYNIIAVREAAQTVQTSPFGCALHLSPLASVLRRHFFVR